MLQEMLDPRFNIGHTPHRLAYDESSKNTSRQGGGVRLHSLTSSLDVVAGTTRIIRIYRHQKDKIDLDQRIDWELPLSEADSAKIEQEVLKTVKKLTQNGTIIGHIFVKDLHRGVVSEKLISSLKETFKHASWYVSSKLWNPGWFKELPERQVRLILIPQLAAAQAINEGSLSSSSWMTSGGVPSKDAIHEINAINERFSSAKIVVLPEGMRVLAFDGKNCHALPAPGAADELPFTPMASVFFPALGAYMIASKLPFSKALKDAVSFTATWEKEEAERTKIDDWVPSAKQELSLNERIPPPTNLPLWREFKWDTLSQEWQQAFSKLGVVSALDSNGNARKEFQLWRAMTDIRDYVTCMPEKRRHVITLIRAGRSLKHPAPGADRKTKSFFIVDEPGSGKSFMVERLAATLDLPYLKFNIASLSGPEELPGCFRKISELQSKNPDAIPIVFFDEMNAMQVYGAFLEPLEDGSYNDGGNTVHLKPCMWIFAGTKRPMDTPDGKGRDFESRLSHEVMYLNGLSDGSQAANKDLAQLENVYIGVATIRSQFPDVTKISQKVLRAFSLINTSQQGLHDSLKGPRGIRRFVNSFEYVQYGKVVQTNLFKGWNEQMAVNSDSFQSWEADPDNADQLVEIKSRAEG